jgi:antitoxin (DNA-binding transcriptional repressor) of toxin-antitoxin stability system
MKQIAVEEEEKLGALVDLLERGEEVVITRNGREIARAVPAARAKVNPAEARAALQRIRKRAEEAKLGPFDWQEWKAYRDEGRP